MSYDVLKGVRCIVDVRMSGDAGVDCSGAVGKKLELLGAHVGKRLSKETTHVIWLNGSMNIRESALKKANVKLVGPMWVEACAIKRSWVSEDNFFPVIDAKNYSDVKQSAVKARRRKSVMEPRREDIFDERFTPKRKRRPVHDTFLDIFLFN